VEADELRTRAPVTRFVRDKGHATYEDVSHHKNGVVRGASPVHEFGQLGDRGFRLYLIGQHTLNLAWRYGYVQTVGAQQVAVAELRAVATRVGQGSRFGMQGSNQDHALGVGLLPRINGVSAANGAESETTVMRS
jgi:hypothetical protein